MNRVSEILGDKGRDVLEIDADAPVLEAVQQMVDANVGSLLVKRGRRDRGHRVRTGLSAPRGA